MCLDQIPEQALLKTMNASSCWSVCDKSTTSTCSARLGSTQRADEGSTSARERVRVRASEEGAEEGEPEGERKQEEEREEERE